MKSSQADFRALLSEKHYYFSYRSSIADPDDFIQLEVKPGGFMYYFYVL